MDIPLNIPSFIIRFWTMPLNYYAYGVHHFNDERRKPSQGCPYLVRGSAAGISGRLLVWTYFKISQKPTFPQMKLTMPCWFLPISPPKILRTWSIPVFFNHFFRHGTLFTNKNSHGTPPNENVLKLHFEAFNTVYNDNVVLQFIYTHNVKPGPV